MTEQEWMKCGSPERMLESVRGQVSERKLLLFALACCGRIDRLIQDPRSRVAVDFAIRHADVPRNRRQGIAAVREAAQAARQEAYVMLFAEGVDRADCLSRTNAADAASATVHTDPHIGAGCAVAFSAFALGWASAGANDLPDAKLRPERRRQARMLREILGNPFHPLALDPAWLTPAVVRLAQAAYDERQMPSGELDIALLAILADALEEVGCTELPGHLRGPGPHVRGCWALDAILQKE